jgi:hypothetical protein
MSSPARILFGITVNKRALLAENVMALLIIG